MAQAPSTQHENPSTPFRTQHVVAVWLVHDRNPSNCCSRALFSLKGQTALVTGGSRGIGAAIALALAESGASVCIAQRDPSNASTADAIRSRGFRAEIVRCDLANTDSIKAVFQNALELMGREIYILVNWGGLLKRNESINVSEADWDHECSYCFYCLSLSLSLPLHLTSSIPF